VPVNSTNVRKAIRDAGVLQENARVLFAAAMVWATVMAAAATEGIAAKFDPAELAAFGAVMAIFSAAACRIDVDLRAYLRSVSARGLAAFALAGVAALAVSLAVQAAALAIFVAPLASAALAGWLDRRAARGPTRAPARSPGARRAAT
jgi:hypothetical protein